MKKILVLLLLLSCGLVYAQNAADKYESFKENLKENTGFSYELNISVTAQRLHSKSDKTAVRHFYNPQISYTPFENTKWGSGSFDYESEHSRYFGAQAIALNESAGFISSINDTPEKEDYFLILTYTHALPDKMSWLSLTAGQIALCTIDGTTYTSDPHGMLINESFSASASAAYPNAGFGGYIKAETGALAIRAGIQSTANTEGTRIEIGKAFEGYYNSFLFSEYTPEIKKLGGGVYSFLLYYHNNGEGIDDIFGWSFNIEQNIGTFAIFGKANGVKNTVSENGIKQSYVAGVAYKDPFERNERDVILLSAGYNELDEEELGFSSEKVFEFQWVFAITSLMTITPNVLVYDSAFDGGTINAAYGLRAAFHF
ncbi:MAG: carbohydrate porin [Endomicrobia bacterium]|nr:carbohydrate porin [Endomicrobiia bacterium]MCL2507386.1 carbohydrate porin [Endomicrobiia bacterium]